MSTGHQQGFIVKFYPHLSGRVKGCLGGGGEVAVVLVQVPALRAENWQGQGGEGEGERKLDILNCF